MPERIKKSKTYGLILMKGGHEFPKTWKEHLNKLGYRVYEINEAPRQLQSGELLNRWYPGIHISLRGMEKIKTELAKLTGIAVSELEKLISLKEKTVFSQEDERLFRSMVERLSKHKENIKAKIKSNPDYEHVHTLITSYEYFNRPVQWVLLERTKDRKRILEELGVDEEKVKELLKGRDYREVPEQDFVKAVIVGATNMKKAHPGSLRSLAMKTIEEKGVKETLKLEGSDFYPFIQNVVHCPWAKELDTDLNLLTEEEKSKIKRILDGSQ